LEKGQFARILLQHPETGFPEFGRFWLQDPETGFGSLRWENGRRRVFCFNILKPTFPAFEQNFANAKTFSAFFVREALLQKSRDRVWLTSVQPGRGERVSRQGLGTARGQDRSESWSWRGSGQQTRVTQP
jgi:hypothetical protein